VPITRGRNLEYSDEMDIFSDNLASLKVRVDKLRTDFAWADTPPSRTRHMISNLRLKVTDKPDELQSISSVLVYSNRFSQPDADLFSAERFDRLRRVNGQWLLAQRTVHLDQSVVGARHITVFF
jgi:3-phenylpropionate/cinnamic acid dioxygenase small subunit